MPEIERRALMKGAALSALAFTAGGAEVQVEGDDSPVVRVVATDVFPPAVPSGLQAVASGVGQAPFVDLIWAPDAEARDVRTELHDRRREFRARAFFSELGIRRVALMAIRVAEVHSRPRRMIELV